MSTGFEDIIDGMQLESAVTIDIEYIDKQSIDTAKCIIKDIVSLYHDVKWMEAHPQHKARIDMELETLRGLLKMRQADEQAHDALLQGISANNGNASLYRALSEIQKTSLAVTTKINESITSLTDLVKVFQMNAQDDEPEEESAKKDAFKNTHKGTKDFIKEMNKQQP